MLLSRKHKQTVDRLRKLRSARQSTEPIATTVLARARALARWSLGNMRVDQISHWFPERYTQIMYQPNVHL